MEASPGPSSATGAAGTRTSGRARKPRGEFWMNADGNKSQSKLLLDFPELSERKQGTGTCAPKSQGKGSTGRHGTGPTSELKSPVSAKPGRPRRLSAALAALAQPDDQGPRSTGPGEDRSTPLQRGAGETPERPRQSHKAHELSSPGQSPAAVARRPATRSTPAKEPVPDSAAATHSELAAAAPKSAAHKLRVSSADGTGVAAAVPTAPSAAADAVIAPAVTSPRKKASAKELQMLGSINVIRFAVDEGEAGKRASRARGAAATVPTGQAAAVTAITATAATGAARQAVLNGGGTATSKAAREPETRARVAAPAATTAAGAGGMGDCAAVVAVMGLGVDDDGGAPQGSPPAPDLQRTSSRHGAGRDTAAAAAGGSARAGSARGRSSSGKAKSAGGTDVGSGKQKGPSGSAPQPAQGAGPAAAAAPAPAVQPEADQDEEAARPRKRSRKGGRTDVHAAALMPQPAPHPVVAASTGAGAAGAAPHVAEGPSRSHSRRSGRAAGPSVVTASVQPPPAIADRPVSLVAATATTATAMTAGAGGDDAGQGMAGDAGGSRARSERGGKGSKGIKRRRGQNGSVATNASAEGAAAATASQQMQQQGSQQLGKEASQLPPPQELGQGRQERPAASEAGTDSAATTNRVKAGSKGKKLAAEEKQAVTAPAADTSNRAEALPRVPAERSLEQQPQAQLQAQPQAQPQAGGEDGLPAAAADGHTGADAADGGWSGAMQAALVAASAAASAAKAAAAVCGARSVSPTASVAQSSAGEDAWQRRGSGAPRHTSPGAAAVAAAAAQAAAPGGTLPPPRRAPPPVPRFHDPPPQSDWQPPLAATEAADGSDRPLSRGAARAPAAVGTAASGAGGWVGGVDMPDRMPGRERPPQQQLYRTALEDQGVADDDGAGGFFVRRVHGEGTGGAAGPHLEAEASVTPTRRHGLSPLRQPPLQPRQPPPLGGPHVALGRSQQEDPYGLAADSGEAGGEQQRWHQQHQQHQQHLHLQQQQQQGLGYGNVDYYGHGSSGDGAAPPHQHQGRRPPQLHGSDLLASPRRQSLTAPSQGQGQRVGYPQLQQRGAQQRQSDQEQQQLLSDSRRSSHAHAGGSWQPAAHAAAGGVAGDAYWDAPGGRERVGDRAFSDRQLPMGALYGAGYGTAAAAEPMAEDHVDGGHAHGYPPSMSTRQQPRQQEEEQRRQQHDAATAGGRAAAPEPDWFVRRAPGRVGPGQPERRAEAYTEQQHPQLRWEELRPHPHHAQEAAGQAAVGAGPFREPRMRPVPAPQPPALPPRQQQQQPQPPQPQGQQKHAPLAPGQQAQLQGQARQPLIALQPPRQHPLPQPPGQAHSQPLPQHPPAFAIPTLRGRAHHQQHSQQQHSQPQQEARPAVSSGAATSTVASVFSDSLRRALSRADQLAQRNKTRQQEIAENEEDGWTLEQVQSLQSAYYRVDPLHPHFWREVARGVPGKTAAECFSRVFASGRDREERAALAKALRRRPAAAPAGPSGSTKPLTLAAARKWTRKAHEQEQLERLAHLGGLDRDEDDEEEEDEEEQEEGEEAQGPAAHGRGAAGSRGGRGAGGSRGRGGRRPALAIPDDPTEMRRIIDNLQQKHQADRFITSFLRKQGGWAKWHKAVREAQDRRLRSVSTAAAAAGGSSAALGGGAAARHGPGATAAGVAAAGGQHDSDPLARVIQRMLARDEAEELREMWRDADEAEGLQPYGGGGGAAGGGGGTAGTLYGGDEEDEYDEAREREEEEMRRFLVAEGLLGPDGMPVFR